MRILVISDSHKHSHIIEQIINLQNTAKHIFFLGDNTADIEDFAYIYPERTFHIVSGNCDYFSTLPSTDLKEVGGVKILFTHGHTFRVKETLEHIKKQQKSEAAKLPFSATHINPLYLMRMGYIL